MVYMYMWICMCIYERMRCVLYLNAQKVVYDVKMINYVYLYSYVDLNNILIVGAEKREIGH